MHLGTQSLCVWHDNNTHTFSYTWCPTAQRPSAIPTPENGLLDSGVERTVAPQCAEGVGIRRSKPVKHLFPSPLVATLIFQPLLRTNCRGIWCCQLSICFPDCKILLLLYSLSCGFMPFRQDLFSQVLVEFCRGEKLDLWFSLPS